MIVGYLAAMIVSIALYSAMGIVSLVKKRASPRNRLRLATAIALASWSLAFVLQQSLGGSSGLLPKATAGLSLAFFSLLFHSSLVPLSGRWKRIGLAAVYVGGLAALACTAFLPDKAGAFSRNLGFWVHASPLGSAPYLVQNAFCLAAGLAALALQSVRAFTAAEATDKRAAILDSAALALCLAMFYANQAALPAALGLSTPYFPPLVFAPWALAVLYAQVARASLPESGRTAADAPLVPAPDYSVLVDPDGTILEANEPAQAMLGRKAEDLKGKPLGFALEHPESLRSEMLRMAAANEAKSSCTVSWVPSAGKPVRCRARITATRNSFGRATGYLITPFTLGESAALKDEFSLTDREIEVIHFAAQGLPNNAIARELEITERTVKAHLTNIFNKMGIDSRFKLISRLKDFDI